MLSAQEIIEKFKLIPHPEEGGYFVETYRCSESFKSEALPSRYGNTRNISTAIYYLLTDKAISLMHRLKSDEVFHFYYGDPVEMLHLFENGTSRRLLLGNKLEEDQIPQVVVPHGVWQGARLKPGGRLALIGCTVAPGFDYADYDHGQRDDLIARYSEHSELLNALTE